MSKQTLRKYTLTESVLKQRYLTRGWNLPLICYVCNKEIKIGDRIVRKRRKVYHEMCYENTFLDIPDELDYEEEFYIQHGYYPDSSTIPSTISPIPSSTISLK
jgi:hypothetical protein